MHDFIFWLIYLSAMYAKRDYLKKCLSKLIQIPFSFDTRAYFTVSSESLPSQSYVSIQAALPQHPVTVD